MRKYIPFNKWYYGSKEHKGCIGWRYPRTSNTLLYLNAAYYNPSTGVLEIQYFDTAPGHIDIFHSQRAVSKAMLRLFPDAEKYLTVINERYKTPHKDTYFYDVQFYALLKRKPDDTAMLEVPAACRELVIE